MTIARKIWIGFIIVSSTGVVASALMGRNLDTINRLLKEKTGITDIINQAAYEMEINTNGMGLGIFKYLETSDSNGLEHFHKDVADFRRFWEIYNRVATAPEEKRLAKQIAEVFENYRATGESLIASADRSHTLLASITHEFLELDRIIEKRIGSVEGTPEERNRRNKLLLQLEGIAAEAFAHLNPYLRTRKKEHQEFTEAQLGRFSKTLSEFTLDVTPGNETQATEELQTTLTRFREMAAEAMRVADTNYASLTRLIELRRQLDDLLDEEIQKIASEREAVAIAHLRGAVREGGSLFLGMIVVGLSLSLIAVVLVQRKVISPLKTLSRGAEEFARRNFDHRVPLESPDEVGEIGLTLNHMAASIQELMREIEESNYVLEERIEKRTQELAQANDELKGEIARRSQVEQDLRESEDRFRILADGAFEGIVTIEGSIISDLNKAFEMMSGYALHEIVGTELADLYISEFHDGAKRPFDSESEEAYESMLLRKDGGTVPVWIRNRNMPFKGNSVRIVSVRDISHHKKEEAARRRLFTALEQAVEGIIITDAKGDIEYVNPYLLDMTGYCSDELIGNSFRILKSDENDPAVYGELLDTVKAGTVWSGRLTNRRRNGQIYYTDTTISSVRDESGEIVNFVAVLRDVTEHLNLTKQLLQAQKMEAIGTLAGGVAHDFNNLLQVVLGYSELILADEDLPDRLKEDMGKVLLAGINGAHLVQRLLTFSRKTEPKLLDLDLNQRIRQSYKLLQRTIPRMIDIELILADDLARIQADPTHVDQLLMNLSINARDAMPEGGKLVIETANVVLDEEYSQTHLGAIPGEYVLLSVSDTGYGMDKETLDHIFEPFFTTKEAGKGTGLGLAMVYGIVKEHDGYITCYSEPGRGTTFKIYLPVAKIERDLDVTTTSKIPAFGTETILLVDDEEFIRDLGKRILERFGYTVLTAADGKEALNLYEEEREKISLVILDLIMPKMGGKECLG
ncbi:MAG: PAS domain S-box protein, partial [Deltaproteobacteria bacterium]|nr:PAS domain S-box protein [Deltaproteobacteria bacterium]